MFRICRLYPAAVLSFGLLICRQVPAVEPAAGDHTEPPASVPDPQSFDLVRSEAAAFSPPGTLGSTYRRWSHPVPDDKHPRSGMLAVRDRGVVPHLSVREMGGFRMKNGVWLFESSRPLDPGVSQVVRIEARQSAQDIEAYDSRFVRLIPGRIVYLDFKPSEGPHEPDTELDPLTEPEPVR